MKHWQAGGKPALALYPRGEHHVQYGISTDYH